MLLPKRVKYRRVQRGRMKGKAMRGNTVSQGQYGIVALEPSWITSNQIEAARVAMTRYIKRGGKVWIKIFGFKKCTSPVATTILFSFSPRRSTVLLNSCICSTPSTMCSRTMYSLLPTG